VGGLDADTVMPKLQEKLGFRGATIITNIGELEMAVEKELGPPTCQAVVLVAGFLNVLPLEVIVNFDHVTFKVDGVPVGAAQELSGTGVGNAPVVVGTDE
jgi:hypothetical protein